VRFSSTLTRVKATREPSGESCGLATQMKSKRSFSVMARFCELADGVEFCATREVTIARLMTTTVKRDFMRILAPRCCGESVIVLLRWLVVKRPDVMAGRLHSRAVC
jgi:predicted DNA-binding protein (UPF0278 family)